MPPGNRNVEAVKLLLRQGAAVNAVSKTRKDFKNPDRHRRIRRLDSAPDGFRVRPVEGPVNASSSSPAPKSMRPGDYRGFPLLSHARRRRHRPLRPSHCRPSSREPRRPSPREPRRRNCARLGVQIQRCRSDPRRRRQGARNRQTRGAFNRTSRNTRAAISRSLDLLGRTNDQFFKKAACFACHEQPPTTFASAAARAKGIPVDDKAFRERLLQITSTINPVALEGAAALGCADNNLYSVEALVRAEATRPTRITDYLAANLALSQGGDGGWHLPGYSRSPLQDSDFSRTAMAMRALKAYGTPGRASEMKERLAHGKLYLLHADPVILEDADMRLVGVAAAGASPAELRKLAAPILAAQRADGGWAQRQGFPSDAYATGMAIWSLNESGVMPPDAKAVKFPAWHTEPGRLVACGEPCHEVPAIFRKRLPVWARPVDFHHGHGLGRQRARPVAALALCRSRFSAVGV